MNADGKFVPREKIIARTSIISIAANIALAAAKAVAGIAASSISMALDALNNLSDALSSIITIIGIRLASRKPDKKHPYGHGRIEYVAASVISAIVIYAGIAALKESAARIIRPQKADYSIHSLAVLTAAVLAKIILSRYVKAMGKKAASKALEASAQDALGDALLSLSVLAGALAMVFFGLSLEAYIGIVISVFIVKSGIDMLKDTLDDILGTRVPRETAIAVKESVCKMKGVYGAYDLFLNDYGPDRLQGSIHIEVDDTMTAAEIDELCNDITMTVYKEHRVILTAVGIYSRNTNDPFAVETKEKIISLLEGYKDVLQMHGFYIDREKSLIKFDIIISFESDDREAQCEEIRQKVLDLYPGWGVQINLDSDASD